MDKKKVPDFGQKERQYVVDRIQTYIFVAMLQALSIMTRSFLLTLLVLFLLPLSVGAQDGKTLFEANCTSCHNLDRKLTGPALRGAVDRWEGNIDEMVAFVKNSTAYMAAGRPKSAYAQNLFKEYNNTVMTAQALNDDQVKAILDYIQTAPAPVAAAATDKKEATATIADSALYSSFLGLVGILLLACLLVVFGIAAVSAAVSAREAGKELSYDTFRSTVGSFLRSKFVVTALVLVVLFGAGNSLYKFMWNINLHNGYQPVQPIAFSHALHAGEMEIDCKYCHIGVEKGKSATFPATQICLNCHSIVNEGPKYGKTEIAKILRSDSLKQPIEWVRIHNLPDFVYFSHAQHVKVAGLECQECHGEIEKMEEVKQHSRLSMGWCINCHREKEVDLNKSDYYKVAHAQVISNFIEEERKKYEKLTRSVPNAKPFNEAEARAKAKVTVETLGGLECARCHY